MRFCADHRIAGLGPRTYEALYFDEAFNRALCEALAMERELTQRDVTAERIVRRVSISPRRNIPPSLRGLLGGRRIAYAERVDYVWGSLRGRWTLEPALLADRIHGAGDFVFSAVPGGTRRVVAGELTINIFGLGGLAERAVVAEVERSYDAAARFTNAFVAEHARWQHPDT